MDKDLDTSALENYRISILRGGGWTCAGNITRAVIDLSGDISPAMPNLSKTIESCGYNPTAKVLSFSKDNMVILVNSRQITVYNAEDEAKASTIVDWLKIMINTAE